MENKIQKLGFFRQERMEKNVLRLACEKVSDNNIQLMINVMRKTFPAQIALRKVNVFFFLFVVRYPRSIFMWHLKGISAGARALNSNCSFKMKIITIRLVRCNVLLHPCLYCLCNKTKTVVAQMMNDIHMPPNINKFGVVYFNKYLHNYRLSAR